MLEWVFIISILFLVCIALGTYVQIKITYFVCTNSNKNIETKNDDDDPPLSGYIQVWLSAFI